MNSTPIQSNIIVFSPLSLCLGHFQCVAFACGPFISFCHCEDCCHRIKASACEKILCMSSENHYINMNENKGKSVRHTLSLVKYQHDKQLD